MVFGLLGNIPWQNASKLKAKPVTRVWLIIFRKIFQHSAPTFSRMFCSHVGVSDHSATLSVSRCQVIDLLRGALTDLRCIAAKCKCKSSLSPFFSLLRAPVSLALHSTVISEQKQKKWKKESNGTKREPGDHIWSYIVRNVRNITRRVKASIRMQNASEFHISSTDKDSVLYYSSKWVFDDHVIATTQVLACVNKRRLKFMNHHKYLYYCKS